MSEVYKLTTHIPAITGLPRDDSINSLYFRTPAAASNADLDAMIGVLSAFYTTRPTGHGLAISEFYSPDRDATANAVRTDVYHIPSVRTLGPHGYPAYGTPIHALHWSWAPNASHHQPMPDQVAVAMSYRASTVGVVNVRKYRGRIFLGPFSGDVLEESAGSVAAQTVKADFIACVNLSAQEVLQTAMESLSASPRWVQWSPTDWAARDVVEVSVDDRFDTQRRRLERASSRSKLPIT